MLNVIALQGRLVSDPELKHTQNGVSVALFRIACDRDYKKEDGQTADFINIVAWRQTAELVGRYFTRGSMILISGRLQIREYTGKEGQRRSITEVVAEHVSFAGSRRESEPRSSQAMDGSYAPSASPDPFANITSDDEDDGELPF